MREREGGQRQDFSNSLFESYIHLKTSVYYREKKHPYDCDSWLTLSSMKD